MATTPHLVLITGATGFIGFRTLIETLKAGYRVRAALEFVLVPDILKEEAYDEAVKGVDHVIHLAKKPTTDLETKESYDEMLIQPAVRGTMNMLKAASRYSPTTKRIIITAFPHCRLLSGPKCTWRPAISSTSRYGAGKVAAFNATEEYVRTQKPHFDINHIAPSFTIGRNELASHRAEALAGTNVAALGHVLGSDSGPTPSNSVFVNDSGQNARGQFFLGVSENSNTRWEDSFDIVKKHFPEAVDHGTFPLSGKNPTKRLIFDNEYTRRTLGMVFASFEEQVKSVAEHYLELED